MQLDYGVAPIAASILIGLVAGAWDVEESVHTYGVPAVCIKLYHVSYFVVTSCVMDAISCIYCSYRSPNVRLSKLEFIGLQGDHALQTVVQDIEGSIATQLSPMLAGVHVNSQMSR